MENRNYIKVSFLRRKKNIPPHLIFRTKSESDVKNFLQWFMETNDEEYFLSFPTDVEIANHYAIVPIVMFDGSVISQVGTSSDPLN